jgi:hypothetical protein
MYGGSLFLLKYKKKYGGSNDRLGLAIKNIPNKNKIYKKSYTS